MQLLNERAVHGACKVVRVEILLANQFVQITRPWFCVRLLHIDLARQFILLLGEERFGKTRNAVVLLIGERGQDEHGGHPWCIDRTRMIEEAAEHDISIALRGGSADRRNCHVVLLKDFQKAHSHHAPLRPASQKQLLGRDSLLGKHCQRGSVHVHTCLLLAADHHVAVLLSGRAHAEIVGTDDYVSLTSKLRDHQLCFRRFLRERWHRVLLHHGAVLVGNHRHGLVCSLRNGNQSRCNGGAVVALGDDGWVSHPVHLHRVARGRVRDWHPGECRRGLGQHLIELVNVIAADEFVLHPRCHWHCRRLARSCVFMRCGGQRRQSRKQHHSRQ